MSHQEEMRKSFIADIAANPKDLARRLIFADWLEDNGEPERAEFIRHGYEISIFGNGKKAAVVENVTASKAIHDMAVADAWQCATGSNPPVGGLSVLPRLIVFRHGFIEKIHGHLNALVKHLPRIVQEHPILVVRATDVEPSEWSRSRFPWRWYREESDFDAEPTGVIPDEVFLCLPDDDVGSSANRCRYMEWKTEGAAHAALSEALLKLARGKVVSPEAPA